MEVPENLMTALSMIYEISTKVSELEDLRTIELSDGRDSISLQGLLILESGCVYVERVDEICKTIKAQC